MEIISQLEDSLRQQERRIAEMRRFLSRFEKEPQDVMFVLMDSRKGLTWRAWRSGRMGYWYWQVSSEVGHVFNGPWVQFIGHVLGPQRPVPDQVKMWLIDPFEEWVVVSVTWTEGAVKVHWAVRVLGPSAESIRTAVRFCRSQCEMLRSGVSEP